MKYIDSEKLIAEIKRLRNSALERQKNLEKIGQKTVLNEMIAFNLDKILSLITSLQQEQSINMIQWTGDNLQEVIDFTGKSPRFGEWFKSWDEFESYVHSHGDILKLFSEDGSHYEVPAGAWIIKTPDGYNVPSVAKYIQQKQPIEGKQVVIITETDGDANIHWDCRSLDDVKALLASAQSFIVDKQVEELRGIGSGPDYNTTEGRFRNAHKFQQEQPEEYESLPKVRGWVARFADGSLGISKEKPFYYEADGKTYISGYETVFIDKSLFPELHWLDEPVEVELLVRRV